MRTASPEYASGCRSLRFPTWRRLVLLVGLMGFHVGYGHAQTSELGFQPTIRPVVAHIEYVGRDGAPGAISALAQSQDGYLWIGAATGLYRFDGLHFSHYPITSLDPNLPSADVSALAPDQEGGLWIGFRLGGICHLSRNGNLENYNRQNGKGPGAVEKLVSHHDSVWAIADGKLLIFRGGSWDDFGTQHGLPPDELFTVFIDRSENTWTAARNRLFVLRKGKGRFEIYPTRVSSVVDFAEMPDGTLWISDAWHAVRPLVPQEQRLIIRTYALAHIVIEPSGTIWIAQDYRGVSHVQPFASDPSSRKLTKEAEISSDEAGAILRDRDGNIWIGTTRGLDRFQPASLSTLAGVHVEFYPALASDPRRGVWIATMEHPMLHVEKQIPRPTGPAVGSSPIVCDEQGRVWLVDPKVHALTRYEHGQVVRVETPKAVHNMVAQALGVDRDGAILAAFLSKGLWRFDGSWQLVRNPSLPAEDALAFFRDSQLRLWIGYPDGLILMRDDKGFHRFAGLQTGDLGNVLTFSEANGKLWAAGARGISYFDGNLFHRIHLRRDELLRGISGVVGDHLGNLWLNAITGIIRISRAQVQEALRGDQASADFDLFDEKQGVIGNATQVKPTPSVVADEKGILWFSTAGNVFAIDPAKISIRQSAPNVVIQSVVLNGKTIADREHVSPGLRISAQDLARLEIDYAGIDLTAPDRVIYKYRLEGEDTGWQEVGTRNQAFYSHLRPKRFRFDVLASNGNGKWAGISSPMIFTVTPAFYQTHLFYAFCLLMTLGFLYLSSWLRIRYLTSRENERIRERSRERLRIARELHDTLLQSIQGLMLRFHFATEALPPDEPARNSLEQALARADQVIVEGRERVKELRQDDSGTDLSSQIASIAAELNVQERLIFRVTVEGKPRMLRVSVKSELASIAREALTNATHHSGASHAEVSLTYGNSEFTMKSIDNGVGMSPSLLKNGAKHQHWGLIGMRERAVSVGATFEIWSLPGKGTELHVSVPAKRAYLTSPIPGSSLHRLFSRFKSQQDNASACEQ